MSTGPHGWVDVRVSVRATSVAVLVAVPTLLAGLGVGASPAAAADVDCATVTADSDTGRAVSASVPMGLLDIAAAQAAVPGRPGAGQTVAVVDGGIAASASLPRVEHPYRPAPVVDYHGTAVAGLVAGASEDDGPVGVAPAARLLDVRVYDESPVTSEGARAPTSAADMPGL